MKPDQYLSSMVRLLCFVFIFFSIQYASKGQYKKAEVSIDGFTCSMCAMSVENSIRQLPFVADVKMDLNKSTAQVFFMEGKELSIKKLGDQVYRSGFSVRSIQVEYEFPALSIEDFYVFKPGKEQFHFLGVGQGNIKGSTTIIFLNKKLISRKEYPRWQEWIRRDEKKNGKGDDVYYITIVYP
jgi:copper chaperone CopZ